MMLAAEEARSEGALDAGMVSPIELAVQHLGVGDVGLDFLFHCSHSSLFCRQIE